MSDQPQFNQRNLDWGECYNVRDLGGLPAVDDNRTRWQAIIRADLLGRLTPKGQQALIEYGVRTIIDLRSPQEAKEEPSALFLESDLSPTYVNLPIEKYYPHVSKLISQAQTRAEEYCIILDYYPDSVAEIMRAIAFARPGGVVIHCHAGKDRTGIIAALLLSLAGVPHSVIAADYAESQVRLWPLYEKIVAEAGGEDQVGVWLKPIATPETMHTMLAHVENRYGGVQHYLYEAGLSEKEVAQLKSQLFS